MKTKSPLLCRLLLFVLAAMNIVPAAAMTQTPDDSIAAEVRRERYLSALKADSCMKIVENAANYNADVADAYGFLIDYGVSHGIGKKIIGIAEKNFDLASRKRPLSPGLILQAAGKLGYLYTAIGQFGKAADLYTTLLSFQRQGLFDQNERPKLLTRLSSVKNAMGEYGKAVEYAQTAVDELDAVRDNLPHEYFLATLVLADAYSSMQRNDGASKAFDLLIETDGDDLLEKGIISVDEYLSIYNMLATAYANYGYFDTLIMSELCKSLIPVTESDRANLALLYSNLGYISGKSGNLGEGLRYVAIADSLSDGLVTPPATLANAKLLSGLTYSELGDHLKAIDYFSEAGNFAGETSPKCRLTPIIAAEMLRSVFLSGQYKLAIDFYDRTISLLSHFEDKDNELRVHLYALLSMMRYPGYNHTDAPLKAVLDGIQDASLRLKLDELYPALSEIFCYTRNDYKYIARTQNLLISDAVQGLSSRQNLLRALTNSARYAYIYDKKKDAVKYANRALDGYAEYLAGQFIFLTPAQRAAFWNNHRAFLAEDLPRYALKYPELTEKAYTSAMFSKGILLETEMSVSDLIVSSGDTRAMQQYEQVRQLRNKAAIASTEMRDSMAHCVEMAERQLVETSSRLGDITGKLTLNAADVRNALTADEAAIEFVRIPDNDTGVSEAYAALIVTPRSNKAVSVTLGNPYSLETLTGREPDIQQRLDTLVWQPMARALKDIRQVCFAADGVLHRLPVEAARPEHIEKAVRLSSTRNILLKKNDAIGSAAIFGAPEFYAADTTRVKSPDLTITSVERTLRTDTIAPLAGAQHEAMSLKEACDTHRISAKLHLGTSATESAIKNLSAKAPQLLHIATHGVYFSANELRRQRDNTVRHIFMLPDAAPEDLAMQRSALLMAGAGQTLRGNHDSNTEDGILTAREIATLDLHGTRMVMLSACQSGLGDLDADGVFGLQRGFKKAGAETIIMSLWPVNDHATELFVTQFYKSLLDGAPIHDALGHGRSALKDYTDPVSGTHPYNRPEHWAAFIALDAL